MSIRPKRFFTLLLMVQFTNLNPPEMEHIANYNLQLGLDHDCPRKNTNQLCPDGLTSFVPGVCYVLLENQTYPPQCPYLNFLPYDKVELMIHVLGFKKSSIWVHTIRNTSRGFGNYEWIERGDYYGETIRHTINTTAFNPEHNCMVVRDGVFFPTDCLTSHSAFCAYAYNMSRFCANNANISCILSHFDLNNGKCYCKKVFEQPYLPKMQTCEKFAEPIHPFQNFMLLLGFERSETCWLGLQKVNSTFGYISSKQNLSYNYFSSDTNCHEPEVAIKFARSNGWTLLNDSTLGCSFCEIKIEPRTVRMELYHDTGHDLLTLMIHNPRSISDWSGKYNLYCFSNVNVNDFNYRLDLDMAVFDVNSTVAILKLPPISQIPGHYWCAAFQYFYNNVTFSNTIVTYNRTVGYGYEYSLHLNVKSVDGYPLIKKLHVVICNILRISLAESNIISLRPMMLLNFNDTTMDFEIVAHLTTNKTKESHLLEYRYLKEKLSIINGSNGVVTHTFLSASACFPESTTDVEFLEWPETVIGANAIPINRICLDNHQIPVTRKCGGDFMNGARWLAVQGNCAENATRSETTNELLHLLRNASLTEGVEESLANTTVQNEKNASIIDVYLISRILDTIVLKSDNINDVSYLKTITTLMTYNRSTLRNAQQLLNSTDQVLFCVDTFLSNLRDGYQYRSESIFIAIIDLRYVQTLAFIVHNNDSNVDIVRDCTNMEDIIKGPNVEMVAFLSNDVINYVKSQTAPHKPLKLIASVFFNDYLFNEVNKRRFLAVGKNVMSIVIPDFKGFLLSPIRIIFKRPREITYFERCAFWDYGWDQLMTSKYGKWKSDTNSKKSNVSECCEFYHTTHFGMLVMNPILDIPEGHEKYFNILSYVGLALSLMGIVPIFTTAIIHKTWRRRPATIILIQICITIAIQAVLVFLNELVTEDGVFCTIIGVGTHYFLLSEFCWMIVIGHLQYRKFVIIMKPPPSNILQISSIIGWGAPLFPVFVTLAISTTNYGYINGKYCYIRENYFMFFLLLPIIIIFSINAYIFTKIVYSIYHVNKSSVVRLKNYRTEISLAILLFFMLGLTWIFAFFATMEDGGVFAYMFLITTSIRGFVLFIFFIVRNKEVRHLWIKEALPPNASGRVSEVTADHSSG